jgi:hypothetical protein
MHDLRDLRPLDAKVVAKRLASALKDRKIDLSHGECLDIVARQFGVPDWNVMAAQLARKQPVPSTIEVPEGWLLTGKSNYDFSGGVDPAETHQGRPVFFLRCTVDHGEDASNATLMQIVAAESYAGRRVRYSGWLCGNRLLGSAAIWLQANDVNGNIVAFGSLDPLPNDGAIKGTMNWTYRQIVLYVPEQAKYLHFGFYLNGPGEARFSGLDLQVVGPEVPLTISTIKEAPRNLDFSRPRG